MKPQTVSEVECTRVTAPVTPSWQVRRERGSVFSMKLIAWLSLALGRRIGRLLLYPICMYFVVFSGGSRQASRRYLNRALGRPARMVDVFRHHYFFAATLLDRAFLLADRGDKFVLSKHGLKVFRSVMEAGRGCLLLGAHLGSFDLTRFFGAKGYSLTINMMMYEENARKVNTVIESLGGKEQMKVIPVGGIDALLRAKDCVERGEMIGILGDRVAANDRVVRVPFLGREAVFPAGPMLIASALRIPVILFFGIYRGGNHYEEYFELFADDVTLSRNNRQADLEKWVGRYAARLEHYCRDAPYNWFNFFDFWDESPHRHESPASQP